MTVAVSIVFGRLPRQANPRYFAPDVEGIMSIPFIGDIVSAPIFPGRGISASSGNCVSGSRWDWQLSRRSRPENPPTQRARHVKRMADPLPGLAFGVIVFSLMVWSSPTVALAVERPQRISFYPGALNKPLEEKISLGNEDILNWQHQINLKYDQDIRPTSPPVTHPLIPVVRTMIAELPPLIKQLASKELVALFLLQDDFGSGTTEAVQDEEGNWRYSYIALNLSALDKTANAWGSWKESSTFKPDSRHRIRMILETPGEDTVAAAIRFIFLHELGHVLGLGRRAHGFWDAESVPPFTRDSAFVGISWRLDSKGKMASLWKIRRKMLAATAFYSFDKSPLPASQAVDVYRDLAGTDFPSLYGSTNLFDDFAETFAIYVHTVMMRRPYRVDVLRDGESIFTYRSCINTGQCPQKVAALKAILQL